MTSPKTSGCELPCRVDHMAHSRKFNSDSHTEPTFLELFKHKFLNDDARPCAGMCMLAFAIPLLIPGITLTVVAFQDETGFSKYGALHIIGMVILAVAILLAVTGVFLNIRCQSKVAPDEMLSTHERSRDHERIFNSKGEYQPHVRSCGPLDKIPPATYVSVEGSGGAATDGLDGAKVQLSGAVVSSHETDVLIGQRVADGRGRSRKTSLSSRLTTDLVTSVDSTDENDKSANIPSGSHYGDGESPRNDKDAHVHFTFTSFGHPTPPLNGQRPPRLTDKTAPLPLQNILTTPSTNDHQTRPSKDEPAPPTNNEHPPANPPPTPATRNQAPADRDSYSSSYDSFDSDMSSASYSIHEEVDDVNPNEDWSVIGQTSGLQPLKRFEWRLEDEVKSSRNTPRPVSLMNPSVLTLPSNRFFPEHGKCKSMSSPMINVEGGVSDATVGEGVAPTWPRNSGDGGSPLARQRLYAVSTDPQRPLSDGQNQQGGMTDDNSSKSGSSSSVFPLDADTPVVDLLVINMPNTFSRPPQTFTEDETTKSDKEKVEVNTGHRVTDIHDDKCAEDSIQTSTPTGDEACVDSPTTGDEACVNTPTADSFTRHHPFNREKISNLHGNESAVVETHRDPLTLESVQSDDRPIVEDTLILDFQTSLDSDLEDHVIKEAEVMPTVFRSSTSERHDSSKLIYRISDSSGVISRDNSLADLCTASLSVQMC